MQNALIAKLERGMSLSAEDRRILATLTRYPRFIPAQSTVIKDGEPSNVAHILMSGLAFKYDILENGRRQIVTLLIPGDFCNLDVTIGDVSVYNVVTLTPCTLVAIQQTTIEDLMTQHGQIARALWRSAWVDASLLRAWLVNMGQRPTAQRIAHLLCETLLRLQSVDLATDDSYDFPLRQTDLADALGLSIVHINRSLQMLRAEGLLVFEKRRVMIPDVARLKAYAGFSPDYLYLT